MPKQKVDPIITNIPEYNGAGIYIIRNIENGKVYIGSSKHIRDRLKAHDTSFRHGRCNTKFYNDIIHGHKFTAEVIEELHDIAFYELRDKEQYYTKVYDSYNNGYNTAVVPTYDPYFYRDNKTVSDWLLEKL